ncbi:MAG: hypothetical protein Kow0029_23520 [Candidatus Rifleibacteriota bacterium]
MVAILFALILCLQSCLANDWQFTMQKNGSTVSLVFAERLAIEQLRLPAISEQLWGAGQRCGAVAVSAGTITYMGSTPAGSDSILIELNGNICDKLDLVPLYLEPTTENSIGHIEIKAVRETKKILENKLRNLTLSVIDFQKRNNCFSCHTAFPLALALSEADRKGLKIPQTEIEKLGESLCSMQSADGSYHFPDQPDYGTISPTICAGAICSLLVRFDKRLLVNLDRIMFLLPGWLDEQGNLKSDFFFKPLFLGQSTSTAFEALIIAAVYYYEPSITGIIPNDSLRQRLNYLNIKNRISNKTSLIQDLVLFLGIPYVGQINDEQKSMLVEKLHTAFKLEPNIVRPDISAMAAYFSARIGNRQLLKKIVDEVKIPANLSEQIWHCLIEILSYENH